MSISADIAKISYGKKTVLKDVKFELPRGSLTAVIGRNGSGKSTLLSALLSLLPCEGKIAFDNRLLSDMSHRERALTVTGILQSLCAPHITVYELAALGRAPHIRALYGMTDTDKAAIKNALLGASVDFLQNAYLDEISGGELKRAYFAMALSSGAENILFDEATASMDSDYENSFLSLARTLADGGKTVMSVMHNLEAAVRYADRIILLDDGRVSFFGKTEELLKTRLIEETFNVERATANGMVFFYSK